jgi:N12 class adenine-specific DNA methylase
MSDMPIFGTDPVSTKTALEDIAIETGTPIEVLYASAELEGAQTPQELLAIARQRGQQVGPRFKAGEDPNAIVSELFGEDEGRAFGDYATNLRAQIYGTPREEPQPEGGFRKAIGVGADTIQQSYGSAVEGVGGMLGLDGVEEYGREVADRNEAEAQEKSRGFTRLDDVDGLGSFGRYASEVAGQQVPQMGSTLAGAAAGGAIGSVVPVVGTAVGAAIGGLAVNLPFFYGQNRERQKDVAEEAGTPVQVNEGAALLTAVPQAALDVVTDLITVSGLGVGAKIAAEGGGILTKRVLVGAGKGAGAGVLMEVPTEIGQSMLERMQAGLPLDTEDAVKEYIEVGVAAGLLGGALGGVGGGAKAYRDRNGDDDSNDRNGDDDSNDRNGDDDSNDQETNIDLLNEPGTGDVGVPPGTASGSGAVPPMPATSSQRAQGAPTPTGDALSPQGPSGDATQPATPSPLSDVAADAPDALLGGFRADQPVQIQLVDQETGEISDPMDATFLGEDPASGFAQFRGADGTDADVELADIANGVVIVTPALAKQPDVAAPETPDAQPAPEAPVENLPPIPQGVDPDEFMDTVDAMVRDEGMTPDDAYMATLQRTLSQTRDDVAELAENAREQERQRSEEASRIDEAMFTDDNGDPVIFPTQRVAESRLGEGYSVEPFGGGFIGVRQQAQDAPDVDVAALEASRPQDAFTGDPEAAAPEETLTGGQTPPSPEPVAEAAPDQEQTPTSELQDLRAKARESIARKEEIAKTLSASGKPVRLTSSTGQRAIAGPDMSKPGGFRLTYLDENGTPNGHSEFGSFDAAIRQALDEQFEPDTAPDQEPIKNETPPEQDVAPDQPETAPADQETSPLRKAVADAIAAGEVEYTTRKGKKLKGYVLKGFKPADITGFDTGGFAFQGGTFIRKDRADKFAAETPSASNASDNATGPFGPVISGYKGDWKGAALELERRQTGEATGALNHRDVGDISLVWGKAGTRRSDGYGLSKLIAWHPEVLDDLQGRISRMTVTSKTENRIQLESDSDRAGVRLDWDGQSGAWLIGSYDKGAPRLAEKFTGTLSELWGSMAPLPGRGTKRDNNDTGKNQVKDSSGSVDYPNRKLGISKARVDAPVNGIGDSSDLSLGNIALANAKEGDVLPGYGTVLKVTPKQLQVTKLDGAIARLSINSAKLETLARDMGALIASSANLRDEQLGSLIDMIERDPTLTYRDGVPMLFDDPAEQANRGERGGRKRIGQPLTPPAKEDVDAAAADADPNPTDGQKEAGNYQKGHIIWNGMNLTIENAKGSERSGTDQDGETWSVTMPAHYGYFKQTEGADGEHVDFYMGEAPDADYVMWIDQADADSGKFDEHKIMVGFPSRGAALTAYRGAFNDGRADERIGAFFEGSVAQLKAWLESTSDSNFDSTKPVSGNLDFPFKKKAAPEPKPTNETLINVAADSVDKLRSQDVYRVLEAAPADMLDGLTDYIETARPDLLGWIYSARADILQDREKATDQGAEAPAATQTENTSNSPVIADTAPATSGLLSGLSQEKQDRAAELKARLAAKVRNQASSGLDPEYIILGGELVALYIEGGAKKFGQMLRDFAETTGLSMREAQEPMRAAYNHVRDNMDLAGEDISGMDDASAVMAEVRAALAEEQTISQNDTESDTPEAGEADQAANEGPDEQSTNQDGGQREPTGEVTEQGMDGDGQPDSGSDNDGRREDDEDGAGEPAVDDEGGSVGDGPGSSADSTGSAPNGTPQPNYVISDDFALGEGTDGQKLAANMAALRLVFQLESENRYATREEQDVLARWVGWGGLKTLFDEKHKGTNTQWGKAQAELKQLLSGEQYVAAMRSTNDAHYTSRVVVKAMWRAMRNFGFDGGRALEPTIGSGNFLGLQPADLSAKTEWYASELDPITGMIAKNLYPQANVFDGTGFQDAPFRSATFDVAIGNPPFGAEQIGNKKMHPDLGKMKVHNFIIAKTGQLLREGGIMSMVVTSRFLDTPNSDARRGIAPDFNFLGAIRLPNTAFEANANTQVTTDIVFFQKRKAGEGEGDTSWLDTGVEGPNGTRINSYFAANPDMMLGRPAMDGTMYAGGRDPNGKGEFTLHDDGRDMQASLDQAIDSITATLPSREEALEAATTAQDTSSTLADGKMMLDAKGKVLRGRNDGDGSFVEEVTQDTFWQDEAEAKGRLVQEVRALISAKKARSKVSLEDRINIEQRAKNAAVDAGLIDLASEPMPQKAKYEAAMADNLSNLLFAEKPTKEAMSSLETYEKQVNRKRLGSDGFQRLSAMLDLRQKTKELIGLERADAEPQILEGKRRTLRETYRKFKKAHGYLNNSKNEAVLRGDVGTELALEIGYKPAKKGVNDETAKDAPILSKRVIYPHKMPDSVESVADGLHVSMAERGHVDPILIGELSGKSTEDVVKEMTAGQDPMAFKNPKTGRYELAEVYLSGNLAERIKDAESAGMYQNVPHLNKAMPPAKRQDQITPSIRSLWIPKEVFSSFLQALGYPSAKVSIQETVGMASVETGSIGALTEFGQQFATERMDAGRIFEHAIKGKIPVVYDTIRTPEGDRRVKNEEATKEAVAAYERMSKEFPEWAYANPERAGMVIDAFNAKMNVVTERKYEGVRYLRMVGNSPEIDLRNSQKNGAWRMIQDKVTLLHHVVGAGKTFTAIAGIMERKRMGLTRKAVVAVPNHLTGQWGREWLELYPAANILVPTEKDFAPANRSKLINRIATGDYDAVIIGHSQLTKIENDADTSRKYLNEQIEELNAAMQEARASGQSRRSVGQMGSRLNKLTDKLKELNDKLAEKADSSIIGWKDLGVDYLAVDEAHLFKNLEYTTTASRLVGMNPPGGSQRAFDMLMKVRTLQEQQGSGVAFLTGTPISNSLVEIYSMMKYLIPESLKSMGIGSFDAWKAGFIQDESRFEYTASMQLKERNIMSGMINLGPLSQLYRSFSDIVMRPDVERMYTEQMEARNAAQPDPAKQVSTRFPTPKIKGGARRISLAPPTPKMTEFVRYLVMRMAGIKANKSNKDYMSVDNALWVLTDARKASVDIRTIDPTLGREEGSKVDRSSAEVFRIWEENKERKGAQMVFCDMSAPSKAAERDAKRVIKSAYEKLGVKGSDLTARLKQSEGKTYAEIWGDLLGEIENAIDDLDTTTRKRDSLTEFMESEAAQDAAASMFTADTGFSFYDDMRAALIEKGVPEDEIAFIHDYNTTIQKNALFEAVNEGRVRVLLGSTQKMGAGTNAQKKLVALHHIDAPWRPSDMEQREGRIIRQGNEFYQADPDNFEVEIIAYSTEQTADVVQWQVLERKASAIETFMNAATDSIVEEGGDADQYAEFMAQSTGKEIFLQKMQAEKDRDNARAEIASKLRNLSEAKDFMKSYDGRQRVLKERADDYAGFSVDKIGDGADSYLADWDAQAGAYREEKARLEALADEIRERNKGKPRKEQEKLPEMPTAPTRWTDRPSGGWERKVYDVLKDAQENTYSEPKRFNIAMGGGWSVAMMADKQQTGAVRYRSFLMPPNADYEISISDDFSITAKDFRKSDKLLRALSPENIAMRAEAAANRFSKEQNRHAELKPQMQSLLDVGVDRSKVIDAEERLARLSALVRVEEVKFASENAALGENYFAARDDKGRDLIADDTAQPITENIQFKNAGQTYVSDWGAPNGTRRIEGTDKTGRIAIFEAENMDTGEAVIIEAQENATKDDEGNQTSNWSVLNIYDAEAVAQAVAPDRAPAPKDAMEMRLDDDGGANFRASQSKPSTASFQDATQAKRDINKTVRQIEREVGKATGGRIALTLNDEAYNFGKGYESLDGYFLDGVIGVSMAAPDGPLGIARHEVIHALRSKDVFGGENGAFTKQEWRTLVAAARKNKRLRAQVEKFYAGKSEATKIEEIVAEMYREWADGRDTGLTAAERGAMQKLKDILDAIINVLTGNGMNTAASVFERVRSGEVGGRDPDPSGTFDTVNADPADNPALMASISKMWSPKAAKTDAALDKKEASFVSNLLTNAMASSDKNNSLALVPGEVLFRDLGKALPSAAKWVQSMRQMTAERQEMHAEADVLAREWQGHYAKDKENGRKLHDLMHESTIEGMDPSEKFKRPKRPADMTTGKYMNFVEEKRSSHASMQQKFNALPEAMQDIYRKARDSYRAFDEDLINAMVDAVAKAMELQSSRLKARYEGELQQIIEDGLTGAEATQARKKARSRYNQDIKMLEFSRNARIRKMRLTYESNRIDGPYFPLMRFGQFFVAARDAKGKLVHFERASTAGAQQRIASEMQDQGLVVEKGVMKPEDDVSRFVDPNFVADIAEALGEVAMDGQILDAIYQRYLETLPSFSVRKANIHRKGVPGFDRDAIKAFGSRMFHGAHQLTRLRHAMDLTKHVENARREAKNAPDPTRAGAIANEMQKRHDWSMNPTGAQWSAWATSGAFVWYLGLTPAAAVVNLTQTTVVGIPILVAGIKGATVAKASKALTGALADFTAGLSKGDAEWSRGALTSGRLKDDERAALQQAYLSGALDKSESHDLAGIQDGGVQYSPVREKVMRPISFLFHHAERLNREVTFLAAYRMAKNSGMDQEAAVKKAGDLTWDTHFNYENWSRPRFMQDDWTRVAFVFRQFQVNMLYRLFRDTHQAFKGESPEVRKQARTQLIGITSSMMLHAGITGTWGYALTMLLAGMFFDGGSDEAEEELKGAIVGLFGTGAGGMILKGVPGTLTGTDMTARIGMPELWFRSPNRQLEGRDAYYYMVDQLLGAVPAIGLNMLRGVSLVADGEVWRGAELMVPKAIRDQMRSVRYVNEGVTTYKGDPLLDDVSAHDAVVQAIGFSPARVSERYETNRRMMNMQTAIQDERRAILSDITRYMREGEPISKRALRRMQEFNAKYPPTYRIDDDTIMRSYRARLRTSQRMTGGVLLNTNLEDYIRGNMAPMISQ